MYAERTHFSDKIEQRRLGGFFPAVYRNEAVAHIGEIDPNRCRARVAELFPFRAARCIETESCRFRLPLLMRRAPVYPGSTDAA